MEITETVEMSYEEMIEILKGLIFGNFDRITSKEREAIDKAITLLEKIRAIHKIRVKII